MTRPQELSKTRSVFPQWAGCAKSFESEEKVSKLRPCLSLRIAKPRVEYGMFMRSGVHSEKCRRNQKLLTGGEMNNPNISPMRGL